MFLFSRARLRFLCLSVTLSVCVANDFSTVFGFVLGGRENQHEVPNRGLSEDYHRLSVSPELTSQCASTRDRRRRKAARSTDGGRHNDDNDGRDGCGRRRSGRDDCRHGDDNGDNDINSGASDNNNDDYEQSVDCDNNDNVDDGRSCERECNDCRLVVDSREARSDVGRQWNDKRKGERNHFVVDDNGSDGCKCVYDSADDYGFVVAICQRQQRCCCCCGGGGGGGGW
jgi:hypothetical protein